MSPGSYTLWLPGVQTPTLNETLRQHFRKRAQGTRALAWALRCAIGKQGMPAAPLPRAHVVIERRSYRPPPDTDGLIGGCKGLIDCLLPFHEKKRKYGLGFVLDDSPSHMWLEVRTAQVKKAEIGMHITIVPIGALA